MVAKLAYKYLLYASICFIVFILETCYDQLTVFSVNESHSVGSMSVPSDIVKYHMKQINLSFPYRTKMMEIHKFDDIKVRELTS